MMDQQTKDKLEMAVVNYVDGLDLDALVFLVTEQMWEYYTEKADLDEILEFIDEVGVTHDDI